MNCQQRDLESIHRYLDDELAAEEREALEAHLATCASCQGELQALGAGIQRLTSVEWLKAPSGFTESLLAQLEVTHPPKRNWRVPLMKYTGIAAAVLLVFGMGMMMSAPDEFALQAKNTQGLIVANNKVIVPEGSTYDGDLVIQNGDIEVRGKVKGNVTALNGKVYRAAGADISGETEEVDEALEKLAYYGKQLWQDLTNWAR